MFRVNLFEGAVLSDDGSGHPHKELEKLALKCATSGRDAVFLGLDDGQIKVLPRDLTLTTLAGTFTRRIDILKNFSFGGHSLLLGVGSDTVGTICFKWWRLDEVEEGSALTPQRTFQITVSEEKAAAVSSSSESAAAAAAAATGSSSDDASASSSASRASPAVRGEVFATVVDVALEGTVMSLGLSDGRLFVIRADFLRDRQIRSLREVFRSASGAAVTAVSIVLGKTAESSSSSSSSSSASSKPVEVFLSGLLVVTMDQVVAIHLRGSKATVERVEPLDADGAPPGCAVSTGAKDQTEMAVSRFEGVYYFTFEARGACTAIDGEKRLISVHRQYLCIVTNNTSRSGTVVLNVYDLQHKLIVFTATYATVTHIVSGWGSLLVFEQLASGLRRAHQLTECDMQTKMDRLFKRNLFQVAISMAEKQQYADESLVNEISKRYADHCYAKGDYDGAVAQFVKTIGHLEPSYVIRKFLDAQRIEHLTRYLEQLHEKGFATAEHTTLLINCFTKLKSVEKLDHFIERNSALKYDVEAAVKVCRQANDFDRALQMAYQHDKADWVVKILIDDCGRCDVAIHFIATLEYPKLLEVLRSYGKVLVTALPDEMVPLLQRVCTNYRANPRVNMFSMSPAEAAAAPPAPTSAAGSGSSGASLPTPKKTFAAALGEKLKQAADEVEVSEGDGHSVASLGPSAGSRRSPAEDFVHFFADQPRWLMIFLEYVILVVPDASKGVFESLLDLYLRGNEYPPETLPDSAAGDSASSSSSSAAAEAATLPPPPPPSSSSSSSGGAADETEDTEEAADGAPHEAAKDGETAAEEANPADDLPSPPLGAAPPPPLPPAAVHEKPLVDESLRGTKALSLLKDYVDRYDAQRALMICRTHKFDDGLLFLYQQQRMFNEIIQFYIDRKDSKKVIEKCTEYGKSDQNMWIQVLSYFCDSGEDLSTEISALLAKIEQENILPPLLVLDILSRSKKATLGTVKEYVLKRLDREQQLMEKDLEVIRDLGTETAKMRAEITELQTSARVFQLSKCSGCGQPLELPAVHFLCQHSFHLHCTSSGEKEGECPKCSPDYAKVRNIRENQEQQALHHDGFFKNLKESKDRFATVAEYFGRGIFRREVISAASNATAAAKAEADAGDAASGGGESASSALMRERLIRPAKS